jgi:hypothetical protein
VVEIVVYSRRGCHLCDDLLLDLEPLCKGRAKIIVRDVDSDPAWADRYGTAIPVVCVDNHEICRYHLDREAVERVLAARN